MAKLSETNTQNSDMDAEMHPTGARIERMLRDHADDRSKLQLGGASANQPADIVADRKSSASFVHDEGAHEEIWRHPAETSADIMADENLRPSERYTPPTEPLIDVPDSK